MAVCDNQPKMYDIGTAIPRYSFKVRKRYKNVTQPRRDELPYLIKGISAANYYAVTNSLV